MRHFKVLHLGAGQWPKDSVVSEGDIRSNHYDLDGWLRDGAVVEVPAPSAQATHASAQPNRPPPTRPASGPERTVTNEAADAKAP